MGFYEEEKRIRDQKREEQLSCLIEAYNNLKEEEDYYMKLEERLFDLSKSDIIKEYLSLQDMLNNSEFGRNYSTDILISKALKKVNLGCTDDDIYVYMGNVYILNDMLIIRYRSLQATYYLGANGEVAEFETKEDALEFEQTHNVIHPPLDPDDDKYLYEKFFNDLRIKYYKALLTSSKEDADEMIAQYVKKK